MADGWFNLPVEEVFRRLDSSPLGLDPDEAARRLAHHGPNELVETYGISPWKILAAQFTNPLVVILMVAAVVAALLEEVIDAIVILLIVVLNALFGFVQEFRAEKAIQALKALASPKALVVRGGETMAVATRDLVPGDVVVLAAGDKIPADMRLFAVANLKANEASLTGESMPVGKGVDPLPGTVYVGDRVNMCFMGSVVDTGRGKGVVVATGMETELGKIAGLVQQEPRTETPLQRQLAHLARRLGVAILLISVFIFLAGYLRNPDLLFEMFLTGVSLAVAAIPEGLPAVVTISLALGLQRMARRNTLIRRLPAVEALGSASVICSDKTGTLTAGQMNVRVVSVGNADYEVEGEGFAPEGVFRRGGGPVDPQTEEGLLLLLRCGMLCNDARLVREERGWAVAGDATEGALLVAGMRAGLDRERLEEEMPRIGEIGFTSERKRMTTIHASVDEETLARLRAVGDEADDFLRGVKGKVAWAKGAPESLLSLCSHHYVGGRVVPLTEAGREAILAKAQRLAGQAYRVLALAHRPLPDDLPSLEAADVERDLVYLGLVGMMDAPRRDATEAVRRCKIAGIEVVMITGDHKLTAVAIAREMGILGEGDRALAAEELDRLSAAELADDVERIKVYARVSPQHKMKIIDAWKAKGYIVAMTGDGVNDAPALKRSDLGVAMGITGTDVAKESADMVLTDDNFASIVAAVEEGRGIYENIRKFVAYLLSANAGEVLVMFVASFVFLAAEFQPFLFPIHLLWINLVTDGLPALALGVDPYPKDLMERRPRNPRETVINRRMFELIAAVGAIIAVGTLLVFWMELPANFSTLPATERETILAEARTAAFTTIVVFELFFVFSIRSPRETFLRGRPLSNPYLLVAVVSSFVLQLAVVYLPFLWVPFRTAPLDLTDWLLILAFGSLAFVAVELSKVVRRPREARRRA
jgi:Ca2+-transporting ATPase